MEREVFRMIMVKQSAGISKKAGIFQKILQRIRSAVILNEAAVHFMDLKNPVGETVTWLDKPLTVIGVINDMVMESPYDEVRPVIYYLSNEPGNLVFIKINPANKCKRCIE